MKFVVIFTENGSTNYRWHYSIHSALQERAMLLKHSAVTVAKVYQLTEIKP